MRNSLLRIAETYDVRFRVQNPGGFGIAVSGPMRPRQNRPIKSPPGSIRLQESRRLDAPRDVRTRSFDPLRLSNMSSLAIASDLPPSGVFHAYSAVLDSLVQLLSAVPGPTTRRSACIAQKSVSLSSPGLNTRIPTNKVVRFAKIMGRFQSQRATRPFDIPLPRLHRFDRGRRIG